MVSISALDVSYCNHTFPMGTLHATPYSPLHHHPWSKKADTSSMLKTTNQDRKEVNSVSINHNKVKRAGRVSTPFVINEHVGLDEVVEHVLEASVWLIL